MGNNYNAHYKITQSHLGDAGLRGKMILSDLQFILILILFEFMDSLKSATFLCLQALHV